MATESFGRRLRVKGAELRRIPPEGLRSFCRPLMDPAMVAASDAAHMRDDDVVLGLSLHGEARAYPWWIMDNHHLTNDTVAGWPVVVVLCEVCSSAVAFDPVVDGRRLTFEVGFLYNGTNALRDHQTKSIWAPYLASAIHGQLEGTELRPLPLSQMEWSAWRELHPETLVLADEPGARVGHGSQWTIGDPKRPTFHDTVGNWDTRLLHYTLVLGVVTASAQRAYPLAVLRAHDGVVNDELGGNPIVVLFHRAEGSYGALAFSRDVDGRALTFGPSPTGAVDRETGSVWTVEGRAVSGPLAGRQLAFVESHVAKWYVWAAFYPSIQISGNTSEV